MRPQTEDDDDDALDSLLDTMTNVVGILIIVLVVMQLGVGNAVRRITENMKADPEEFAKAEKNLKTLEQERDTLLAAKTTSTPTDTADGTNRLEKLLRQIGEQEKLLQRLERDQKDEEERLASARLLAAQSRKQIEENEKRRQEHERLQGELSTAAKEIARLGALLEHTPIPKSPLPKVVHLPNPRSAPEDMEPLTFICFQNKVYYLPDRSWMDEFRKRCQQLAVTVAQKQYRTFNPTTGEGTDRFLEDYNRQLNRLIRDDSFEVKLGNYSSTPHLEFHPRETGGYTERIVTGRNSRFQQRLRLIDPSRNFLRFYVCPDSFDIYVTTRRIVSDMGLLAGWEPQSAGWKYLTHLGGELRFGPPPKPAPPPKTPPKPRPKRLPNEID